MEFYFIQTYPGYVCESSIAWPNGFCFRSKQLRLNSLKIKSNSPGLGQSPDRVHDSKSTFVRKCPNICLPCRSRSQKFVRRGGFRTIIVVRNQKNTRFRSKIETTKRGFSFDLITANPATACYVYNFVHAYTEKYIKYRVVASCRYDKHDGVAPALTFVRISYSVFIRTYVTERPSPE